MASRKGSSSSSSQRQRSAKAEGLRANRARAAASEAAPEPLVDAELGRDLAGLALAVLAIASLISVLAPATAPVTRALSGFYHLGFGLGGYVLPFALLGVSALVFIRDRRPVRVRAVAGAGVIFVSIISLLVLATTPDSMVLGVTVTESGLMLSGGFVGFWVASALSAVLGKAVSAVVLVGAALAGAILIGFSLSGFAESVCERAGHFAERRRVDVNERPWGDEPPEPSSADSAGGRVRVSAEGPVPEAPTTVMGGAAPTTLIEDVDDGDEDPFVDLSGVVAAESAPTTLIPVEDRFPDDAAAAEEPPFDVDGGDLPSPSPVDTASAAGAAFVPVAAPGPTAVAPVAPVGSAAGAATQIPDFLLHPKAAHDDPGASAAEGECDERVDKGDAASFGASASGRVSAPVPSRSQGAAGEGDGEAPERVLPPISMLRHNPNSASAASSEAELKQTAESLQATLTEFKLHSSVVGWISGPTVTTFKVQPGEGERVSRIQSLEDDIALSLAAQSVRIFAPIPGTSLVGIEIPNHRRQNVFLADVLPYVQGGPLELAIGRDAEGSPIVADLAKMPHLLIAGTTGSGKSVMINSIVMTLLMRTVPEDVRLIMVDPKRVELAGYNGLPHLYVPVVTEPKQAASALAWGVSEMERRLKVFERLGVRNIATFNAKQAVGAFEHYDNPPKKMPYLVIIIDELSDLMMVAGKDVEASIVRIAQLGRAAGIHLIVATQRPSSNVVTGLIKANITNRIAFNVATGIDSRVIIDQMGAEKLTGLGDMLFSKVDWGKPKRIQGCFVSDEEINSVVDFVKEQGEAEYHEEILSQVAPAALSGGGAAEPQDDDPLVWEAARIVIDSGLGSTSGLQRRLKVGYARAGRIMDMLEEKGVVGPPDGSKPREVLLDAEGLAELERVEHQMAEGDSEVF